MRVSQDPRQGKLSVIGEIVSYGRAGCLKDISRPRHWVGGRYATGTAHSFYLHKGSEWTRFTEGYACWALSPVHSLE